MDKYTMVWGEYAANIERNGIALSSAHLVSDIEKLQAVVEAARELSKEWSHPKNRLQLLAAISNVQPKTIQQLQDERNSAVDEMLMLSRELYLTLREKDAIDKIRTAKSAHEAALAKQTGE